MRTARHRADTSTARAGMFGVRPGPGGARAAAAGAGDDQGFRTRGDATHDARLDALLEAVVSMSAELDIGSVLERFVAVACTLTGARYGAISVLGEHGRQEEFVQQGIDPQAAELIGHLPDGGGVLGHLVHHPETLRLHDLGDHPASTGFPAHHPHMSGLLGVPVRDRGAVFGNLYLTDKVDAAGDLVDFTARDEQVVEALASAAAVSLGHARARRRARAHATWLETGVGATARLAGDLPRDEAVADVLAHVRATAEAQEAILFGVHDELPAPLADDLAARWPALRLLADGRGVDQPAPTWALAVPLHCGGRWVGALGVFWPATEPTTAPRLDLPSIAGFGEQLALALDIADAQAARARLPVLEERERIARDLHDMVIQRLFAIGLDMESIAQEALRPEMAHRIESAVGDLDETIKDVRTTIFRLNAEGATDSAAGTSLRARVDAEVLNARQSLGFLPHLRTDGATSSVPEDIAEDVVAVVREALANIARHAHAHEVVVRLEVGFDLLVGVRDDGVGMPPDSAARSGLANLEARASSRQGTFELTTPADGGSELQWCVPLPRAAPGPAVSTDPVLL